MLRLISFSLNTSSAAATRSSVSAWSVTPFSPAQAMVALVPRKSNRWESSFPAWFSALSTSWRSTLLTTSKDESAMAVPLPLRELPGLRDRRPRFLYAAPVRPRGGLPEWPMGADCKSVGLAYEGSNPSPATPGTKAPDQVLVGGLRRPGVGSGDRRRAGTGDGAALQALAAEEEPAEGDVGVAGAPHGNLDAVGLGGPCVEPRPAVGQLVGHRRLGGRARQRQLGADPGGIDRGLVGLVRGGQGRAVADRLHLLLLQEGVGGGDGAEGHERSDRPAEQDERQAGAALAGSFRYHSVRSHAGSVDDLPLRPQSVGRGCGRRGRPAAGPAVSRRGLWTTPPWMLPTRSHSRP